MTVSAPGLAYTLQSPASSCTQLPTVTISVSKLDKFEALRASEQSPLVWVLNRRLRDWMVVRVFFEFTSSVWVLSISSQLGCSSLKTA